MSLYESAPKTFEDLVAPLPSPVKQQARSLRRVIQKALPESQENVYGGKKVANALYSIGGPNNVVCGMQPTESHIKVFFHGWKALTGAGYSVEGSGKNARHIKVRPGEDIDDEQLQQMISIAEKATIK